MISTAYISKKIGQLEVDVKDSNAEIMKIYRGVQDMATSDAIKTNAAMKEINEIKSKIRENKKKIKSFKRLMKVASK